jgi:hypothetical protein
MHNLIKTAWNFYYTVIIAESREDLQAQLNVFGEYCQKWKLKVNVEQTKMFIVSRGRPLVDIHFSSNGSEIEIENEIPRNTFKQNW